MRGLVYVLAVAFAVIIVIPFAVAFLVVSADRYWHRDDWE